MNQTSRVESPCISVCELDESSGFCQGCWRTRDEIAVWASADDDLRREILAKLHDRRDAAGKGRRRKNRRRHTNH